MARSDSEPGETDGQFSDAQAMDAGERDPAQVLMELEALESLLKDRFDGSMAPRLQRESTVPAAAQHFEHSVDQTSYTAFPLFPVRPARQSDTLALANSNVRKRKRQESDEDRELDAQARAERLRSERKKEKKRKRHDKKLMPLVRAESPEPEYPGPGRGRIIDVEDEDPAAVALSRRQIRSVAVSGSSVLKRHLADKWARPYASRVTVRRVLASQLSKGSPFPVIAHATARYPAKGKQGGIPPASTTRADDKHASRKLRLVAYPRQDVPRLEIRVQKQREERKRLLTAGLAEGATNSAALASGGTDGKAIKSNRPVARMGRKKEIDPAEEAALQRYLANKLGISVVAPAVDQHADGEPPKKKKKLGKKERERAKAAKAASEMKEAQVCKVPTNRPSTTASTTASGSVAEQIGGGAANSGKKKRESKKRRMYERLGLGTHKELRMDRKEKIARRKKAKELLKETAAGQVVQPAKAP